MNKNSKKNSIPERVYTPPELSFFSLKIVNVISTSLDDVDFSELGI